MAQTMPSPLLRGPIAHILPPGKKQLGCLHEYEAGFDVQHACMQPCISARVCVCRVKLHMCDIWVHVCSGPASCWEKLKERRRGTAALITLCPGCWEAAGSWSVGQAAGHSSRRVTGG